MRIPRWTIAAAVVAAALLTWGLFHPPFRAELESVPAAIRAEVAKTGFKTTQGVTAASFQNTEFLDGDRWEFSSRQTISSVDTVVTEKRSERQSKGLLQESSGLYAGPLTIIRFERNRPPLVGDLLPTSFWTSTRMTEFAVEERVDFPNAERGRLVAKIAYEGRYSDGKLAGTGRGRVRCDVARVVPAKSIDARLAGLAARIECVESMETVEIEMDGASKTPQLDQVRYAHWYVLERGWAIPAEGEYPVRAPGFSAVRKWTAKLTSFN